MTTPITRTPAARNLATLGRIVRQAFKMDEATQRYLDDTFVKVHLNSRIWMV